jgi:hypothetical protein
MCLYEMLAMCLDDMDVNMDRNMNEYRSYRAEQSSVLYRIILIHTVFYSRSLHILMLYDVPTDHRHRNE